FVLSKTRTIFVHNRQHRPPNYEAKVWADLALLTTKRPYCAVGHDDADVVGYRNICAVFFAAKSWPDRNHFVTKRRNSPTVNASQASQLRVFWPRVGLLPHC